MRLVDELGQNKRKEWGSKLHSIGEMKEMLERQAGGGGYGGIRMRTGRNMADGKRRNWLRERDFLRAVRKMGVGGWWILWGMLFSAWGRIVWWHAVTAVWTAWRNGWTGCRTGEDPVYGRMYELHEKWPPVGGGEKEMYAVFF